MLQQALQGGVERRQGCNPGWRGTNTSAVAVSSRLTRCCPRNPPLAAGDGDSLAGPEALHGVTSVGLDGVGCLDDPISATPSFRSGRSEQDLDSSRFRLDRSPDESPEEPRYCEISRAVRVGANTGTSPSFLPDDLERSGLRVEVAFLYATFPLRPVLDGLDAQPGGLAALRRPGDRQFSSLAGLDGQDCPGEPSWTLDPTRYRSRAHPPSGGVLRDLQLLSRIPSASRAD